MQQISSHSQNLIDEKINALAQIFPEAITESFNDDGELIKSVDFDILRRELSNNFVDSTKQRYSFTWPEKDITVSQAMRPTTKTLRPLIDKSAGRDGTEGNFDSENIYIEGDNLDALKILHETYLRRVKLIYIDPPYNTGKDFIYADNFTESQDEYKESSGQFDDEGNRLVQIRESDGRFHTKWLNMIYPRLKIARDLLTDDGVIFISIDDNEAANLRKICDEIFGEKNFVAQFPWQSRQSIQNDTDISCNHEYVIAYAKNRRQENRRLKESNANVWFNKSDFVCFPMQLNSEKFSNPDNDLRGAWKADPFQVGGWRPNQQYEIINPNTGKIYKPNPGCSWKNDYEHFQKLLADNRIVFGKTGEGAPQRKRFIHEAVERGRVAKTWWDDVDTTTNGTLLLKEIFDSKILFDNPKPVSLMKKFLQLAMDDDSIVMDFFSGSATTAHAVMQLNAEDGGNRKFIIVQLPELTPEGSEAAKAGYKNICEIGKERIRRAGEKIKSESSDEAPDLDIGFRVFKLDSSNLKKWNSQTKDVMQSLIDSLDNFLPGRTELDVVYEILLKMGIELSTEIEEREVIGEKIYIIDDGSLMICLGENITLAIADEITKLHKEYNSEFWQVVFRDTGFVSDMDKTNIKETLKTAGLKEDNFVCI